MYHSPTDNEEYCLREGTIDLMIFKHEAGKHGYHEFRYGHIRSIWLGETPLQTDNVNHPGRQPVRRR